MHTEYALSTTTLGDVLGRLYRSRSSAVVELREASTGTVRRHRLYLFNGLVCGVESPLTKKPLKLFLEKAGLLTEEARALIEQLGLVENASATRRLLLAQSMVSVNDMRDTVQLYARKLIEKLNSFEDGTVYVQRGKHIPESALRTEPMTADEFLTGLRRWRDRFADLGVEGEMAYSHVMIATAFAALGHGTHSSEVFN